MSDDDRPHSEPNPFDEDPMEKEPMHHESEEEFHGLEPENAEPTPEDTGNSSNDREKVSVDKVPVEVRVEVSKLQISLEELQKLEPGSKLPVTVNPHQVQLVVHGKSIGEGEILEMGDMIGVRVTKLYS